MPGRMNRLADTSFGFTGNTSIGSFVRLSSTEAYAVTRPVADVTLTSMRASSAEMPCVVRKLPSCRCSPGLRLSVKVLPSFAPFPANTLMSTVAGSPDASTTPRFVRYFADCATCWRLMIDGFDGSFVLPMKFANGMAGTNCPNVPLGVTANVRLDAKVVA